LQKREPSLASSCHRRSSQNHLTTSYHNLNTTNTSGTFFCLRSQVSLQNNTRLALNSSPPTLPPKTSQTSSNIFTFFSSASLTIRPSLTCPLPSGSLPNKSLSFLNSTTIPHQSPSRSLAISLFAAYSRHPLLHQT